jgi:hypothetical protein
MNTLDDPFQVLLIGEEADDFAALSRRKLATAQAPAMLPGAATVRFHGFDLDEQALVVGLPGLPHEVVAAGTTVPLLRQHIGSTVVVLFDQGDVRRPIIVGVLQKQHSALIAAVPEPLVSAQVDDQRVVLTAEREIVLRCGEASITLTRAGKVLIRGSYVLTSSSGYNKIKGAAVDIN